MATSTARSRKCREADPVRYAYITLKNNAKRRGKPCTISLEYFKKFCRKTKYIQKKGIWKYSYSIDCIKNELGYVEGNLQLLTVSANSAKGTKKVEWVDFGKFRVV